jgi:hypothetical protein
MGMATPIVAEIKAEIDNTNSEYNQLFKKVKMKNPELLQERY